MTVMLYRAAEEPNPQVWDWAVEHRVFDEDAVAQALSEGWVRHPLDVPTADEDTAPAAPKRRGRPPKEA